MKQLEKYIILLQVESRSVMNVRYTTTDLHGIARDEGLEDLEHLDHHLVSE